MIFPRHHKILYGGLHRVHLLLKGGDDVATLFVRLPLLVVRACIAACVAACACPNSSTLF